MKTNCNSKNEHLRRKLAHMSNELTKSDIEYQLDVINASIDIYRINRSIIRSCRKVSEKLTDKSKSILNDIVSENIELRKKIKDFL